MPTPSLAETVIRQVTVIFDSLDHLRSMDTEPNKSLHKVILFACNEMERVAKRRMDLSDYEAARRSQMELLADLGIIIPNQRG